MYEYFKELHNNRESVICDLQVKVILGEDRESTGELISIDDKDGIVRMDLDKQLKILQLRFLGKIATAQEDSHDGENYDEENL